MTGLLLQTFVTLGISAGTHGAAPVSDPGPTITPPSLVQPVQYQPRSRVGGRESLFEPPTLRQQRSLFPSRPGRVGPHYEPPPVAYEPPPVTYRPPSVADRGHRTGRCAPRTRAWYDYCAARFRSFDPNRGTFTAYSGQERPCRCP
jgi:hypothetical protein